MRIAESRLRSLIRRVIFEAYEGTSEEDEYANNIKRYLDQGIKFGKDKVYFLDSPDLFMILDKAGSTAISEFMNVKMLAKPAELAKSEKKIEILKTAYEALMKINNPQRVHVVATYGSSHNAIITYSALDSMLAGQPSSLELFFSDRDDDEWLWEDGRDVAYHLERAIEGIEDLNGGSVSFKIDAGKFLKRASLLHMIINLLNSAEKEEVMGKDSKNWFNNQEVVLKPQDMQKFLSSNSKMYKSSHTKVEIDPQRN